MKKLKFLVVVFCIGILCSFAGVSQFNKIKTQNENQTQPNSDIVGNEDAEIFYADPTIFVKDGKYYLTGTRDGSPLGFAVLVSDNLKEWSVPVDSSIYMILEKGNHVYGKDGFWAPQIFEINNEFLFAYTANEQVALAKSASILGPYQQSVIEPIDVSEKNIDPFIFHDTDGKYYLYHVRFNNGNYLWVAEFNIETGKINPETLTQCFSQTEAWEATNNYPSAPVMEGPTVIKLDDTYYLFYSANHFMNIDYSVGYATSSSPFGPWVKNSNSPIIHRSVVGENGSGHGDIFKGTDDNYYYVYHVHYSDSKVGPRRTRIVPLHMKWNQQTKVFDFYVDAKEVIVPVMKQN